MYSLTFTAETPAELRQQILDWIQPDETSANFGTQPFPATQPVTPVSTGPAATYLPAMQATAPCAVQPTPPPAAENAIPAPDMQTAPGNAAAPMTAPAGAIPTSAPSYTQSDLMAAGARLMTTVGMPAMQQLLARFNVQAIHQLPPEQYGLFAQALREMGAQI